MKTLITILEWMFLGLAFGAVPLSAAFVSLQQPRNGMGDGSEHDLPQPLNSNGETFAAAAECIVVPICDAFVATPAVLSPVRLSGSSGRAARLLLRG